jgi:hypothetical protein
MSRYNSGVLGRLSGVTYNSSHGVISLRERSLYGLTGEIVNPTLISTYPTDNSSSIPVSSNLLMTFSENVKPGYGFIVISDGSDIRTIDVLNPTFVTFVGSVVTINPSLDLLPNVTYYVQLQSGVIVDLNSNPYLGIDDTTTFNFTMLDTINPYLVSSTPSDNSTGVLVSSNVVLTFSEVVQAGSGFVYLSNLVDYRTISISDTNQITFNSNLVTINPTTNLSDSSSYSVMVSNGAIVDSGNNAFLGITNTSTLNFSVEDISSPTLSSSAPYNGSTNQAKGVSILLTFTESVQAGSGTIIVSNGVDVRTYSVPSQGVVFNGSVVTITPSSDFSSASTYSVQISTGSVKDSSGNYFSGISDQNTLRFTVVDYENPYLVSSYPQHQSVDIPKGSNVILSFSESVQAGTGSIWISNGSDWKEFSVTDTSKVTFNSNSVTINPLVDFIEKTTYYVSLSSGVITDLFLNPFPGITNSTTLNFTISDTVAPTLTASTPSDNATSVAKGSNLILTFSEVVQAGTGNIILSNGTDIRTIPISDTNQITLALI